MNILRIPRTCAAIALLAAAPFAIGEAESPPVSARAAFVDHAAMRDWQADGDRGLWIQAGNRRWFYAHLARVCHGLSSMNSLAFETHTSGQMDRTSVLVMPQGAKCPVQCLAPSGAPPQARVEPAPQTQ
jgi:Family of unknown function (DUF6491)